MEADFVLYVRSQPLEPTADLTEIQTAFRRVFFPLAMRDLVHGAVAGQPSKIWAAPPPPNPPSPRDIAVPVEQARCGLMTADIARRMGRSVRVVDVSRELAPHDIVQTPDGEEAFFPILVRRDGARLSGESDFTPGRVRKFLSGR